MDPRRIFLGVWPCAVMVAFGCGGNASEGSNSCDAVATGGATAGVLESSAGAGQGQGGGAAEGQAGAVDEAGKAAGADGSPTGGAAGIGSGTASGGTGGTASGGTGGTASGGTGGMSTGGSPVGGTGVGTGGAATGGAPNGGTGPVVRCAYAGVGLTYYDVGDTFYASDGCNTCVCGAGGQVSCTEMICTCDDTEENPNRVYLGSDPNVCSGLFTCPGFTTSFSNQCGCGCQQSPDCPPYLDCMPRADGSPPPCTAQMGKCPYSPRSV
jgi:hypothetical protein